VSLAQAEIKQAFPYTAEQVYNGLIATLGPAGYKLTSQDKVIGRIRASSGMSGFSWGENIAIQVVATSDRSTELVVQSDLKLGVNLVAASKNKENAERIIASLSHYLQNGSSDPVASAAAAPSANVSPLAILAFLLVIVFIFWAT
jgi:hypothetical protein